MSTPRDPVQFTRESADRIAGVVRTLELTPASGAALNFGAVQEFRQRKVFRVCTFTGTWPIGESKTLTFKNQTATPNTALVENLFFPFSSEAAGTRDCGIAKEGTAWYLIDVPLATATATVISGTTTGIRVTGTATATVISGTTTGIRVTGTTAGISVTGTTTAICLTDIYLSAYLNTSDCTITIGKTLTTASMTFATGTATATFVTGTATALHVTGTATAMIVSSTATAVFVTGTVTATYLTFG